MVEDSNSVNVISDYTFQFPVDCISVSQIYHRYMTPENTSVVQNNT